MITKYIQPEQFNFHQPRKIHQNREDQVILITINLEIYNLPTVLNTMFGLI